MSLALVSIDLLWRNALGAIPLAIAVALICRWARCKPSTRHALWLMVLLSLLAPPALSLLNPSRLLNSIRSHVAVDASAADAPRSNHQLPAQRVLQPPTALRSSEVQLGVGLPNSSPADTPTRPRQAIVERVAKEEPQTSRSASISANSEALCTSYEDLPTACGGVGEDVSAAPPQVLSITPEPAAIAIQPIVHDDVKREQASAIVLWKLWLGRVFDLRDAIAGLTPIPNSLWLAGSAMVLLVMVIRIERFRRLLRTAEPAADETRQAVKVASRAIGLLAAPQVLMTARKISPLVWCCRRRLLVLPIGLWDELDDDARQAVLFHELAHLKRRDHLICWVEMMISLLYWWHPLVWWVRRQIRDEADFACDAWVTALLPGSRRAYATALLTTRQYVSEFHNAAPAVGLGVSTPRAKRFARRLTMVMTERSGPRLSIMGTALAVCVATAGWLAAPLLACPPTSEECAPAQSAQHQAKLELEKALAKTKERRPGAQGGGVTTYEAYMADRDSQPRANPDDLRGRIDQLEQRLDRLTGHLEQLLGSPRSAAPSGQGGGAARVAPMQPQIGVAGMAQAAPTPRMPRAAAMPGVPAPPARPEVRVMVAPPMGFSPSAPQAGDGEVEIRLYRLPEGKREDFTKFMSRSDVPILVSPAPEGINVHATPRQHEVIRGFLNIIHPEGAAGGGAWRSTVEELEAEAGHRTAIARSYEQRAREAVERDQMKTTETVMRATRAHHEALARQMQTIQQQSEEMRRRAVELQLRSETLHSEAQEMAEGDARHQIVAEADAIAAEAKALEDAADAQDEQAGSLEDTIDAIQDEIREVIEAAQVAEENAQDAADDAANADDAEEVEEED